MARFSQGQVPYRDYFWPYPPLAVFIFGIALRLLGQKFWVARLPQLNDRLTTRLHCLDKERKNNRSWVTFASETTDAGGEILFRGQMTTIWAA